MNETSRIIFFLQWLILISVIMLSSMGLSNLYNWIILITVAPPLVVSMVLSSRLNRSVVIPKDSSIVGSFTINYTDPEKEVFSLSLETDPYEFAHADIVVLTVNDESSEKHRL